MATVYYENDGNLKHLDGKTLAVIGYGSQGHAHALNLRDSGLKVIVGLPTPAHRAPRCWQQKLEVVEPAEAATPGRRDSFLFPITPARVYHDAHRASLSRARPCLFAHGFSIHFKYVMPPSHRGRHHGGARSRRATGSANSFAKGLASPVALAVEQDATGHAEQTGLAYANGVGSP